MLPHIPHAEHAGAQLRDDRRDRRAGHAHVQHADRQQVEHDIDDGRDGQEPHRRLAVAERTQHAGAHIIEDRRRDADKDDEDIVIGVAHLLLRRAHELQQRPRRRQRQRQKQRGHRDAQPYAARHIPAQLPVVARAEGLRQRDGHAGAQPAAEADDQEVDRARRADAAQGHHAQRVADDRRIDQRIHLLQQKSKQHRDRELPDIPQRLAGRQIMRHGADLLCTYFCHEH